MRTWFALDITVDSEAAEAVESSFNDLDSLGTEIEIFRNVKDEPRMVTGFFDVLPKLADVHVAVNESLRIYGFSPETLKRITSRTVEEADWLAEWKNHWKPTHVGKFVIAPPWADIAMADKIVIRIEPNMAFGTGTHETTQLCLQAISEHFREGQTFLDVGTGTGILAIAAAKVGGKTIVACDTDADSAAIAKENAIANAVGGQIKVVHACITEDTPSFDLVCANLTLDVIAPLLPLLLAESREKLVLSGILVEQEESIAAELRKFEISNFKFEIKGEWISVVISR